MWPLPRIKQEHISIICAPEHIALVWLAPEKLTGLLQVKAYTKQHVPFTDYAHMHYPTRIKKQIDAFVSAYRLAGCYAL